MKNFLIATNNQHKVSEIKSIMNPERKFNLFSLADFGISANVIEDRETLQDNALIKAKTIFKILGIPTISDDTGLFVDALGGEPGVYSARYAGEDATYEENCLKLLNNLKNIPENKRTARFESVICYLINQSEYYFFNGILNGTIANKEKGTNGFGYDPLFIPDNQTKTFAELSDIEKNKISHRSIALNKFRDYIGLNTFS